MKDTPGAVAWGPGGPQDSSPGTAGAAVGEELGAVGRWEGPVFSPTTERTKEQPHTHRKVLCVIRAAMKALPSSTCL